MDIVFLSKKEDKGWKKFFCKIFKTMLFEIFIMLIFAVFMWFGYCVLIPFFVFNIGFSLLAAKCEAYVFIVSAILLCFFVIHQVMKNKVNDYLIAIEKHLDEVRLSRKKEDFFKIIDEYLYYYKVEKDELAPIGPLISVFFVIFSAIVGLQLDKDMDVIPQMVAGTVVFSMIFFILIPNMRFYSSIILKLESVRSKVLIQTSTDDTKLNSIYNKLEKMEKLIKQNLSQKKYRRL